ncbi:unnamed protein product [Protopolystoma xenopodis]|uniref:Uncharacterized protein n=1 Tax=Protopolystoma xenopodis TaxID=117903 RepID=A0A448WRI3_9PLAT|nr:unnamed protein product [Protopolystoma xenopodis]
MAILTDDAGKHLGMYHVHVSRPGSSSRDSSNSPSSSGSVVSGNHNAQFYAPRPAGRKSPSGPSSTGVTVAAAGSGAVGPHQPSQPHPHVTHAYVHQHQQYHVAPGNPPGVLRSSRPSHSPSSSGPPVALGSPISLRPQSAHFEMYSLPPGLPGTGLSTSLLPSASTSVSSPSHSLSASAAPAIVTRTGGPGLPAPALALDLSDYDKPASSTSDNENQNLSPCLRQHVLPLLRDVSRYFLLKFFLLYPFSFK